MSGCDNIELESPIAPAPLPSVNHSLYSFLESQTCSAAVSVFLWIHLVLLDCLRLFCSLFKQVYPTRFQCRLPPLFVTSCL